MTHSLRLPITITATLALSAAWSFAEDQARPSAAHPVDQQRLEQQVTASMLLGKTVVDRDAEKVGEVHDIDLTSVFASPGTATGGAAAEGAVATLLIATEAESHFVSIDVDQVEFDRNRDQLTVIAAGMDARTIAAGSGTRAASGNDGSEEAEQLAPPTVAAADPANTIAPVAVAAAPGSGIEVATTGTDVLQIEEALAKNESTSDVADQVGVLSSADAILLTGQVASEKKREQVLQVARGATHREVRDLMQVAAE